VTKHLGLRWWPAAAIVLIDFMAVGWIWFFADTIRQYRVMTTILAQIITVLLLFLWFMFFSRARWRTRWLVLAAAALASIAFVNLFEVDDFSGDLMPSFRLRSGKRASQTFPLKAHVSHNPSALQPEESLYRDYPQFLGANRDAVVENLPLARDWQTFPPLEIWRRPVGAAWSSFAVVSALAFTQEQNGEEEQVVYYDLYTGAEMWRYGYPAHYATALGGTGPRATPTVNENHVYALGATGILNCLDLKTGAVIWTKNILTDNDAQLPQWGVSGSPLILDSLLVVCPGGVQGRSLVAYDKNSGNLVWHSGSDKAGYSSPMLATVAGEPQILIFNQTHVVSHQPETGAILWRFPWIGDTQKVAQPLVLEGDRVVVTSGYGVGSKLLQIIRGEDGKLTPRLVWTSRRMKPKFANIVRRGNFIYGLDDGILACIDIDTGKRQWKGGRYGHGQLLLVDGLLLVTTEKGSIALVEANHERFNELSISPILTGKTWNNPALAGQFLLVRNSQEAVCLKLPLAASSKQAL